MLSMQFIMSFIISGVALLVGIFVFSGISEAFICPTGTGEEQCNQAKNTAWTVVGIFPVVLFFALFALFGQFGGKT